MALCLRRLQPLLQRVPNHRLHLIKLGHIELVLGRHTGQLPASLPDVVARRRLGGYHAWKRRIESHL